MAKSPPSFDLYPGDLIKSCVDLSAAEFGAYMRLLCYQWEHGAVPSAADKLARICGLDRSEFGSVWESISVRFDDVEDHNLKVTLKVNPRMSEQREKAIETWEARRSGGRLGGRPKQRDGKTGEICKPQGYGRGSVLETSTEEGSRKEEVGSKKRKTSGFDPSSIDLPTALDTDLFKAAWAAWCQHRIELKKPLTETSTKQQLATFATWGPTRAVAAIRHTIEKGWQGIREADTQTRIGTDTPSRPANVQQLVRHKIPQAG